MISSSMDDIMKRFGHKKNDHGVGDKDPPVVGGSDKTEETLEAPSFDLGVGSTQPDILHSEDIQKHVDSVMSDVVTAITTIDTEDPDYIEPSSMELKVTVDDTLPQQMNGESIPHTFDASKYRMDIATLLYKHREMYVKRAR
ncbi:Hypothetical predicted protein [Olea europaea subsp. europaea]|uniref:Uncharacterized protein n=1 Tax=Olea europaea subsp. europaea TaxID=158383 RepID=A0A8S0TAH9_OLEEU|nr:Hypothetical predicted protein [Olea europaea subsp. europaea]